MLDIQEQLIIKELIRNPRTSDNQISKKTKVPLKTVNRKRKLLETKGFLNYFTNLDLFKETFTGRQLFLVTFKHGISRKMFTDKLNSYATSETAFKHIFEAHLGEIDGHLSLVIILESHKNEDILEIFNVDIVGELKSILGDNCIENTTVVTLTTPLAYFHNYRPSQNMRDGAIKNEWPNNRVFVQ